MRHLIVLLGLCAGCAGGPVPSPASRDLAKLCDDYWQRALRTSPTWATALGDRRYEDRLSRIDAAARVEHESAMRGFLDRVRAIPRGPLSEVERVTAEVFEIQMERALAEASHEFWQRDVDQMYGPQVWLYGLVRTHPVEDGKGRTNLLARLAQFPAWLSDYEANLREGVKVGNVAPRVVVDRVIGQLRGIGETPAESCPLLQFVEKAPPEAREGFRAALAESIRAKILPAYARLRTFLEEVVRPAAPESPGIGSTEKGRRAYEHRIWHHSTLRMSAQEVHDLGRRTLAGIQEAQLAIARKLGHDGDLASFNRKLREDPALTYATREEVRADAEANLARAKAFLPRLFGRLPKQDCEVTPIEPYREADAPAAYYYRATADRPGTYYINTFKPEERPRYNMPALSLHEAVPGHHLQIALAAEIEGLPEFRKHGGVTAYVEGWGLYSELLGDEVGFYRTDLERYGMLTFQAWRAARLVVDTGMHGLGWTREQAVQFFRDNVAISEVDLQNEIDRYIMWPGQALAYMIGRLKLQELRRECEAALGARFDLRAFHDEVLRHGAVPLPVLEGILRRWRERAAP